MSDDLFENMDLSADFQPDSLFDSEEEELAALELCRMDGYDVFVQRCNDLITYVTTEDLLAAMANDHPYTMAELVACSLMELLFDYHRQVAALDPALAERALDALIADKLGPEEDA